MTPSRDRSLPQVPEAADIRAAEPWHAKAAQEVLRALATRHEGLREAEAKERLARFGPNSLPEAKSRSPLARFAAQFNNLLILVLLAAGAISGGLGHWLDATVILGVIGVQAVLGFVQEGKAERAAQDLVPGDLVLLEPGDKVPADLRIVRAKGLRVQEAALTGESVPVDKALELVDAAAPLAISLGSQGRMPSASCAARKMSGAPRMADVPGGTGTTLGTAKTNISAATARSCIAASRSATRMRSRLASLASTARISDSARPCSRACGTGSDSTKAVDCRGAATVQIG